MVPRRRTPRGRRHRGVFLVIVLYGWWRRFFGVGTGRRGHGRSASGRESRRRDDDRGRARQRPALGSLSRR